MNIQIDFLHNISIQFYVSYTTVFISVRTVPIRLSGGSYKYSGRVELFYQSEWETVCDDFFDLQDAHVACHQLGYHIALQFGSAASMGYGQGTGPIHMDDLQCTGAETNLQDCKFDGWKVHDCGHSEDVGVVCSSRSPVCRPSSGIQKGSGKRFLLAIILCVLIVMCFY